MSHYNPDYYAHVVDGQILEYPVTPEIAANRGLPLSMFTKVKEDIVPVVPPFHYLTSKVVMKMGQPTLVYEVHAEDLSTLLARANGVTNDYMDPMGGAPDVYLHEVDPALVQRVLELVVAHVQKRMDDFAKTRAYDNIASAVTYRGSVVPSFAAEAERAFVLRDQCWTALYAHLDAMQDPENPLPIPKSIYEIDRLLPELTWEATPAEPEAPAAE